MLFILLMVICLLTGLWLQEQSFPVRWAFQKPLVKHVAMRNAYRRSDPNRPYGKALARIQVPPPPLLI